MNYVRIQCNDEALVHQLATWHNMTPTAWLPDHVPTEEEIQKTIERMKNTPENELFLIAAQNDTGKTIGFIWAYAHDPQVSSIMILSLYVDASYRNQGVATALKHELEKQCRLEGVHTIHSTVHYENVNMLRLNERLGYKPGMINMVKIL